MRLKFYFLIICLIFNAYMAHSQSKSELRELYEDGEYFFIREDYSEALYYFIQLLKYDPGNANLNFKAGTCLLNLPGQEHKAIPFLQKAIKDINVNYNRRSYNERGAPLHALYYLGNAYRINNEIDKALDMYDRFISSPDFYGNYNERLVLEEIKSCERAKIIKDNPIVIKATNIGKNINTKTSDYSAAVSADEKVMVYITSLKFYEGLFYSKKTDDGKWSDPENINAQVMSDGDMFPTGLSYDGSELLLVKKSDVNNDIYYSRMVNGLWTKAIAISDNINSRNNEDYASFSKDSKTIYFTSDRRGGHGGFDIYKSEKIKGSWNEPVNLGENINSPFNEGAPFMTENGKKLFFSSDGHFTMGGYDIFYSELTEDGWKRPVNAGYPLNSTGDNIFFVPVDNGKAGYMSMIKDDGFGDKDIYRISLDETSPMENDNVKKSLENIDLENSVTLKLVNDNSNDTIIIWFNKNTNRFYFDVPEGFRVINF